MAVISESPIIEEIGSEEAIQIQTEGIEEIANEKDEQPAEKAEEVETGKQSRAQKKVMKAMAKHNLKHVPGIVKVVIRRKGNLLFTIVGGEVYKAPGSDTYIVFGEAQPEDLMSRNLAQAKAAEKFKIPDLSPVAPSVPKIEDEEEDEVDEENLDTEGVEDKDIELVMQQAGVSKTKAVKALKSNSNDIVNAIMELTM